MESPRLICSRLLTSLKVQRKRAGASGPLESKILRQGEGLSKDATTSSVGVYTAETGCAESTDQVDQLSGPAFS